MDVLVKFRYPLPPHQVLKEVRVDGLRYGWSLDRPGSAGFSLARGLPVVQSNPEIFATLAALVTLERKDGFLPWSGYPTNLELSLAGPSGRYTLEDLAGSVLSVAATPSRWREQSNSTGTIIQAVLAEVDRRAAPPLVLRVPALGGPRTAFTPRGESITEFLRTMSRTTGWEWMVRTSIGDDVTHELVWVERIGRDLRSQVIFEQNRHFVDADLSLNPDGFISASLAVGGTGTFADRPSVAVGNSGAEPGVPLFANTQQPDQISPNLRGTRVVVEPSVTGDEALRGTAERAFTAPEYVRQRLTLQLWEGALNMAYIELGAIYGVRFKDLAMGLGYARDIRCVGLSLGEDGVIEMATEVLDLTPRRMEQ